jgi:hypothetical protein
MHENPRNPDFGDAMEKYRTGLAYIRKCEEIDQLDSEQAFNAVLQVLMAKDVIFKIQEDQHLSSQTFINLHLLDIEFNDLKESISKASKTEYAKTLLRHILIHNKPKWWKCLYKNKFQALTGFLINDLDWVWKFFSTIFLIASTCIILNIAPRFWAGGVTPEGIIGIVVPSVLTFVLSKDIFEQITNGYGVIERILKKFPRLIPSSLHQELTFIISLIIFIAMIQWHGNLNRFSACYYNRALYGMKEVASEITVQNDPDLLCRASFLLSGTAERKSVNKNDFLDNVILFAEEWIPKILHSEYTKSISQSENDLKRAIAINPDNYLAHFYLGWLYELRQDLKNAEIEYILAMQNNSLAARARLAKIYMDRPDKNSTMKAATILTQGKLTLSLSLEEENEIKNIHSDIDPRSNNGGIKKPPVNKNNRLLEIIDKNQDIRIYHTRVAEVRLEQKRLKDVRNEIKLALLAHWRVIHLRSKPGEKGEDNTPIFCIYGEYLKKTGEKPIASWLDGSYEDIDKGSNDSEKNMNDVWKKCKASASPRDPDDDPWLTKSAVNLPE